MRNTRMNGIGRWVHAAAIGAVLGYHSPWAQETDPLPSPAQLKRLSLEELMDVKVTLASRRAEELSRSASSIQVITRDEIRRAGIFTLPEALRLAANLQVARIDSRQWAITARGQNAALSDKLLVMIDGRSVYTPLYAGVYWDAQDMLIDNIDHIEVISGPGGALWGANAVNGVINIVTRPAEEMSGGFATAVGGTFVRDLEGVRAGGKLGKDVHFYAWSRRFRYYPSEFGDGTDAKDNWGFAQNGFRTDWTPASGDRLTVNGSIYQGRASMSPMLQTAPGQTALDGQSLQARWSRDFGEASGIEIQAYFDRTSRLIPSTFQEELRTWDFDFQHRFPLGGRNSITWGAGYRLSQDDVTNSAVLQFLPAYRDLRDLGFFVQDQIEVWPDKVRLTLGSRFQETEYSGFEAMPSARAAWNPTAGNTLWAAASRSVRAPSRIDVDFHLPPQAPGGIGIAGGPDMGSEYVNAYEAGWRTRIGASLSAALSSFYNAYSDLRVLELGPDAEAIVANGADQDIYGLEADLGWQAMPWWQFRFGATWMEKEFRYRSEAALRVPGYEGEDPDAQYSLRSSLDLPWGFTATAWVRYVSELRYPSVPYYATASLAVGWAWRNVEVSVSGQDLAERRHLEFRDGPVAREIPRSFAVRIGARF
jgi:iron complex outermembrane recepter protein